MNWYYAGKDRKPQGPVSLVELESLFDDGTLSRHSFVIEEGAEQWQRLGDVLDHVVEREADPVFKYDPEIHSPEAQGGRGPKPPDAPGDSISVDQTHGSREHPVDATEHEEPKTNMAALVGCILGVSSLTIGWFCCGINVVTAPAGMVVSVIGYMQINNHADAETGRTYAIAGFLTSLLTVMIWFIVILVYGIIELSKPGRFS